MERGILHFQTKKKLSVMDLQRFLHRLNVFYNRLYILDQFVNDEAKLTEVNQLKSGLFYSLYLVPKSDSLYVHSISIESPGDININGIGEIFQEIRESYKDLSFRNKLDKKLLEEKVRRESENADKAAVETVITKMEALDKYINLMKKMGLSEDEIRQNVEPLLIAETKFLSITETAEFNVVDDEEEIQEIGEETSEKRTREEGEENGEQETNI